jgi:drug/metabolite transporter (DMT)-like permease
VWPTLLLYEPVRGLEIPSKIGPPIAGVSKSGLIRRLQPILGVLPAATAVAAVLRAGEHPSAGFWLASAAGLLAVLASPPHRAPASRPWATFRSSSRSPSAPPATRRGGALARELGGWRVICWAVLLSLPLTLPIGLVAALGSDLHADGDAWGGFAYVAVISALIGFFPWYAGLARGGVAKIGQIQLLQPLLTLVWSAWLLGEEVNALTLIASIAVLASVVATQRTRVTRSSRPPLVTSRP